MLICVPPIANLSIPRLLACAEIPLLPAPPPVLLLDRPAPVLALAPRAESLERRRLERALLNFISEPGMCAFQTDTTRPEGPAWQIGRAWRSALLMQTRDGIEFALPDRILHFHLRLSRAELDLLIRVQIGRFYTLENQRFEDDLFAEVERWRDQGHQVTAVKGSDGFKVYAGPRGDTQPLRFEVEVDLHGTTLDVFVSPERRKGQRQIDRERRVDYKFEFDCFDLLRRYRADLIARINQPVEPPAPAAADPEPERPRSATQTIILPGDADGRDPLDGVSYETAINAPLGTYTSEQITQIADREAVEAARAAFDSYHNPTLEAAQARLRNWRKSDVRH